MSRELDRGNETSPEFSGPLLTDEFEGMAQKLAQIEGRLDRTVADLYGIECEDGAEKPLALERDEIERRRISYALGIYLGRWGGEKKKEWVCLSPLDGDLEEFVRDKTGELEIDRRRFLSREFSIWHNRLYRGRPVFWVFGAEGRVAVTDGSFAKRETIGEMLDSIGGKLPRDWRRVPDEPVHLNLGPLADWLTDGKLRESVREAIRDREIRRKSNCESVPLRG